ncbi:MAG: hypothetical protein HA494_05225 [Thaumarchaeota archaeon]|nr:hypothetical protein [Nitrososphaerota archaeon]
MVKSKRLALATLFGVVIFASKMPLVTPLDKAAVIVQALLLPLGYLVMGRFGATYVAVVGGLLTAVLRPALSPFTLLFALIYGILTDSLCTLLKVRASHLSTLRLTISMCVSTALIGLLSYYTTVYAFTLMPRNLMVEVVILVSGTASGLVGGYIASIVWRKYLSKVVAKI